MEAHGAEDLLGEVLGRGALDDEGEVEDELRRRALDDGEDPPRGRGADDVRVDLEVVGPREVGELEGLGELGGVVAAADRAADEPVALDDARDELEARVAWEGKG